MRYLEPKFSVGSPGTKAYADAWDRIFAKPNEAEFLAVPTEMECAPISVDISDFVGECTSSVDVSAEVTAGCEAPGGSWQGAGGEGEVTPTPSSNSEEGVSGFPEGSV